MIKYQAVRVWEPTGMDGNGRPVGNWCDGFVYIRERTSAQGRLLVVATRKGIGTEIRFVNYHPWDVMPVK